MDIIKLMDISKHLNSNTSIHQNDRVKFEFEDFQRTLDFNFKDSESNFHHMMYITEKHEGPYDKAREPWIQKLASRCNVFGMSKDRCLEYTIKFFEHHPSSVRKDDPIKVKTHIISPVNDTYKRYLKDFDTWRLKQPSNKKKFTNVGQMRTAKQRILDAHNQPDIKMLFDAFWQTGELAILFGDTGLGKSILAVMIADSITKGQPILGLKNENGPMSVLFYDFELSDKQFEKRYSVNGEIHSFDDLFVIDSLDMNELSQINQDLNLDELIYEKIRHDIINHKPQVLVIDNITFLKTEGQQKGDVAKDIMMKLTSLKKEFNLSILVLAHTPKKPQSDKLNINHLAGSKHLSNFADSAFAIGQSVNDSKLKYLKQVKPSRSSELIYDSSNVVLCEIERFNCMLTFALHDFGHESVHLSNKEEDRQKIREKIVELRGQNISYRDIAKELNISKSQAEREYKKATQ